MLVCASVCLSHARSREQKVVLLRFLHRHEKLLLVSCTKRFSSWYDSPFEKEGFGSFSEVRRWRPYTPLKTFGYDGTINPAYEILEGLALRDTPFTCKPKTYPFVNGLAPCTYPTQNRSVSERVSSSTDIFTLKNELRLLLLLLLLLLSTIATKEVINIHLPSFFIIITPIIIILFYSTTVNIEIEFVWMDFKISVCWRTTSNLC